MNPVQPVYPKPLKHNASLLFTFFKKRNSWLNGLFERSYRMKMGRVKLPGVELFMPNMPSLTQRILIDEVASFPKHPMLEEVLRPLLGASIFTTNGEQWQKQRNMLNVAFDNNRVEQVFGQMQSATQQMLARFATHTDGDVVDIEPEMTLVTADIIFRTIMSSGLDTEEANIIMEAFTRFQAATPKRTLLWMFKIPDNSLLRLFDRSRLKDAALIRNTLAKVIKPRYDAYQQDGQDTHQDILTSLLSATDAKTGKTFDFEEILDQVSMLFLAGHETSASALTWTLYLLAITPTIQQEAAGEITDLLADSVGNTDAISLAMVKKLGLIRRVFMEALRLYPPVGFLVREARCAVDLLDKHIPEKATVLVSPWLLHRHEELWDEPTAFCPMRFLRQAGKKGVPKHGYLPFGLGERVCIGATFATQEAMLILAALLTKYTFELAPNFQPEPVGRLTIRPANGMKLIVRHRTVYSQMPSRS